jgi:hypothetical protein
VGLTNQMNKKGVRNCLVITSTITADRGISAEHDADNACDSELRLHLIASNHHT